MDAHALALATMFVQKTVDSNSGNVPNWIRFKEIVKSHLSQGESPQFKVPDTYYYAYQRSKGRSHADAAELMGFSSEDTKHLEKVSFWRFR